MMMSMIMTNSTISNFKAEPDHVHIFKVEQHDQYKPLLLNSIDQMVADNNIQLNEKGYLYDFNIPTAPRTYESLVRSLLCPYMDELSESYGLRIQKLNTWWFQQYLQNSDFGWHQHDGHWACVYYLELPEMTESTEFLHYGQFNVKEGDVIFFPTFLVHRSPIIRSNQRKTIIATNLHFEVDREMIERYGEQSFKHR
jgi:hypothetical protein